MSPWLSGRALKHGERGNGFESTKTCNFLRTEPAKPQILRDNVKRRFNFVATETIWTMSRELEILE